MNAHRSHLIALAFAAGCLTGSGHAADLQAGHAKAKEICAACHGEDGNSATADYPKIGGQYADYLAKALRDYQSDTRKNAIMSGFAKALSKDDIANLAAYYASRPAVISYRH